MNKVTFLHISKTAGTSVRFGLQKALGDDARSSPFIFQGETGRINVNELNNSCDFFTGHFGFDFANKLDGDIITVLRNPIDRIKSLYLFWHSGEDPNDLTKVFELVGNMSFSEFLLSNDPRITVERNNCITYQLAGDHSVEGRKKWAGRNDEDVINAAFDNLKKLKVIGFQENMSQFSKDLKKILDIDVSFEKKNITKSKLDLPVNSPLLRSSLYESIYMDMQLYIKAMNYWFSNNVS